MRTSILIGTTLIIAAGGVTGWFWLRPNKTDLHANRKTVTVKRGSITVSVNAPGQVVPRHQTTIYTKSGGVIAEVLFKPGANLKAGQVLMRFDASGLESQIVAQDAQIASLEATLNGLRAASEPDRILAQAAVRQAQIAFDAAQVQLVHAEEDLKLGVIAVITRDQARTALEQAGIALEAAKLRVTQSLQASSNAIKSATAQLKAAAAQRRTLEAQRTANEITTPMTGTLTDLSVAVGQAVGADAALAQVADLSSWIIESRVSENDLPNLKLGMSVKASIEALQGDPLEAKISRIGQVKKFRDPIYYYQVDSRLDAGEAKLTPGLATTAEFITQHVKNVPLVPLTALQSVGEKTIVEVRSGTQVRQVEVSTGLDDGTNIAVEGLEPGMVVLLPVPISGPGKAPANGIGKAVGF
jgi:multidrug efflux pump subunit AcrA (membrane-fusion protein)